MLYVLAMSTVTTNCPPNLFRENSHNLVVMAMVPMVLSMLLVSSIEVADLCQTEMSDLSDLRVSAH